MPTDSLMVLTHTKDRERVQAAVANAIETGESTVIEYRIVRRGGETVWVKAAVSTTHISGIENPIQITIFSDITEEKKHIARLNFLNESVRELISKFDTDAGFDEHDGEKVKFFGKM